MQDEDFDWEAAVDVKEKNKTKQKRCYDKFKWTHVDQNREPPQRRTSLPLFLVYLPVQVLPLCRQWVSRAGCVCESPEWLHGFEKSYRGLNRHSVELKMGFGWTIALKCKSPLKWGRRKKKDVPHGTNWFLQLLHIQRPPPLFFFFFFFSWTLQSSNNMCFSC